MQGRKSLTRNPLAGKKRKATDFLTTSRRWEDDRSGSDEENEFMRRIIFDAVFLLCSSNKKNC
jgi:hypothetical protein